MVMRVVANHKNAIPHVKIAFLIHMQYHFGTILPVVQVLLKQRIKTTGHHFSGIT